MQQHLYIQIFFGFFCSGAEEYAATPCDPGYYCPSGTISSTQYPCPAGTYYNLTMARDVMDCLPCPGGEYCATDGLGYPTGKCSQGIFISYLPLNIYFERLTP